MSNVKKASLLLSMVLSIITSITPAVPPVAVPVAATLAQTPVVKLATDSGIKGKGYKWPVIGILAVGYGLYSKINEAQKIDALKNLQKSWMTNQNILQPFFNDYKVVSQNFHLSLWADDQYKAYDIFREASGITKKIVREKVQSVVGADEKREAEFVEVEREIEIKSREDMRIMNALLDDIRGANPSRQQAFILDNVTGKVVNGAVELRVSLERMTDLLLENIQKEVTDLWQNLQKIPNFKEIDKFFLKRCLAKVATEEDRKKFTRDFLYTFNETNFNGLIDELKAFRDQGTIIDSILGQTNKLKSVNNFLKFAVSIPEYGILRPMNWFYFSTELHKASVDAYIRFITLYRRARALTVLIQKYKALIGRYSSGRDFDIHASVMTGRPLVDPDILMRRALVDR